MSAFSINMWRAAPCRLPTVRCDVPRDCKPVERDALWNHRSTRCCVPLGFPIRATDRVARDRLNPFRLNRRHSPSPKAIGFNDFSGDYPFATCPTDCRPGNNLKSSSPSTLIFDSCPPIALRPAFVSTTDVRQQTRQHSLMHPIGVAASVPGRIPICPEPAEVDCRDRAIRALAAS